MKRSILLFAVFLFLMFTFQILPQETAYRNSKAMDACFETLQQGLNSGNAGLIAGCTYMIGEVRCQRSVITLMKMLHESDSEELRILAALSLYKIGDSRGIYAIKQSIEYDESERVRRMCETFYKAYMKGNVDNNVNVAIK